MIEMLAQAVSSAAVRPFPIAWSAFAPELVLLGGALVLMLLAIAGARRHLVAYPLALGLIVAGGLAMWAGHVAYGGVVASLGLVMVAPGDRATDPRASAAMVAGVTIIAAIACTAIQYATELAPSGTALASVDLAGSLALDGIAIVGRFIVLGTALVAIPAGYGYMNDRNLQRPEFGPLLLLVVAGMSSAVAANDLVTLFIAYEVFSVGLYILVGIARRDSRSQEAGIKYLLLGAVTSAIFLYGIALTYAATGTLTLTSISSQLAQIGSLEPIAAGGLVLVIVGLAFKTALVPFHLWTPDVYQGAPTNITLFMAGATKATAFIVLMRLLTVAYAPLSGLWIPLLSAMAIITMLWGALVALVQTDVKRMLAYSSVAHAGYAAIGIVSADSPDAMAATLWYLATYAIGSACTFGVVIALERRRRGEVTVAGMGGLVKTSPGLAAIMAIGLLSLAGVPPTVGFLGKLSVFRVAFATGNTWLVIAGIVSSVIAAGFYLRLIAAMYLDPADRLEGAPILSGAHKGALIVTTGLVLVLGIVPAIVLQFVESSAVIWQ